MRFRAIGLAAIWLATAMPAAADCYADYKAKRDAPLRLHYGVMEVAGACSVDAAQAQVRARLAAQGWTLLQVVSVFGPEGLAERKANAGAHFLRY